MLTSTWDADLMFPYESSPDAATTVVSDDIWKKFDLDAPLDNYAKRYKNDLLDDGLSHASTLPSHVAEATSPPPTGSTPPSGMMMMMHFDKLNCRASREIRHHDCMWAGLCISKEHNRTLPARRDPQLYQRIPAGHSILIAKSSQPQQSSSQHQSQQQQQQYSLLKSCQSNQHSSLGKQSAPATYNKGLESDGYSTRSQTPGSCSEEEETEESEEDEAPVFRHEQIDVHEQLNSIRVSMPVSEVTGQSIQRRPQPMFDRRKTLAEERAQAQQDIFEDHCYYSPINKKMVDQLGAPTPSDSEEEIDVVSYEKPPVTPTPRPDTASSLPFCPSPNSQNRFQSTVNSAFRGRRTQQQIQQQQRQHQQQQQRQQQQKQHARQSKETSISRTPTAPRPRGRPPNSRKRALAAALEQQKLHQQKLQQQKLQQQKLQQQQLLQQQQMLIKQEIKQEIKEEIKEEILSDFEDEPDQDESSPTQAPPAKRSRNSGKTGGNGGGRKKTSSNQGSPVKQRQSSDSDSDSEKRNLHNNMERQRRIELRIAFDEVRMMCPEIEYKDKAPKVAILKNASALVLKLKAYDEECERQKAALREEQRRLRARLSALRRSLSSMYR